MELMHEFVIAHFAEQQALNEKEAAVVEMAKTNIDRWESFDKREQIKADIFLAHAAHLLTCCDGASPFSVEELWVRAWSGVSSPFSLRHNSEFAGRTVDEMVESYKAWLAEKDRADLASKDGSADKTCQEILKTMQPRFPELNLSFGYIGNCSFTKNGYDDRSWKFFTRLRDSRGYSVSFGGYATAKLGELMISAEKNFEKWCIDTAAKLTSGEYSRVC